MIKDLLLDRESVKKLTEVNDRYFYKKLGVLMLILFIFLIDLTIGLLRKKEQGATGEKITLTKKEILTKSVLLTWLNSQALIDGSLLFGTYRALLSPNRLWLFACGIMVVSPLWFFSLTGIVSYFGKKLSAKVMRKINISCAIFLCLFAFNMFAHVASVSESPVIRVAIVDNLMSQKLACRTG